MQLYQVYRKCQRAFRLFMVMLLILASSGLGNLVQRADAATTWTTTRTSGYSGDLYAVDTDGHGIWFAVGGAGALLKSTDNGASWTKTTPFSNACYGIKYVGNQWVAVGVGGIIYTSTDSGSTWTSRTSHTSSDLYSIATNGTTLVVVGDHGTIVTSTDGSSWSAKTVGDGSSLLQGVTFGSFPADVGGSGFVAVGSAGTAYLSTDAASWQNENVASDTTFQLTSVANANGTFVAVGYKLTPSYVPGIFTSGDGVSWAPRTAPSGSYALNGITVASYTSGKFVAVGDDGIVVTSEDAMTWTKETGAESTGDYFYGVAYANTNYVAVGHAGYVAKQSNPPRSDATLKSMTVSIGATDYPIAFNSSTPSYSVNIPYTKLLDVTPTVNDSVATLQTVQNNGTPAAGVSGTTNGFVNLNVGTNTLDIIVTAQDGSTKKYTLNVTMAAASADLSALSVSGGTLNETFSASNPNYTVTTSTGTTQIVVNATSADSLATMKGSVNGGGQTTFTNGTSYTASGLHPGSNTVVIEVDGQDNGVTKKTYSLTVTVPQLNNANLSGLTVSGGTLNETFSSSNPNYTVDAPNGTSQIQVTATAADPAATLKVAVNGGAKTTMTSGSAFTATGLHTGSNTIGIEVTAQDGTTQKTYNLAVTVAQSSNADLSNLTVSGATLNETFNPVTTQYTVDEAHGTQSVDVVATMASSVASMTIAVNGGTPATVTSGSTFTASGLHTGTNTIVIEVTAENGSTKKQYTLTVDVAKSANAKLADLSVSGGTLNEAFDASTPNYTVSAPNGTSAVNITATVADLNATMNVTVNGGAPATMTTGSAYTASGLHTGDNTILITVTAEDGTTKQKYTLTVNVAQSANNDLSDLAVNGATLQPSFVASQTDYTVDVPSTHGVDITATVADSTATVTVDGNAVVSGSAATVAVTPGSTRHVAIIVTAENGTPKQYNLTINVAQSSNADLSNLTVSGYTLNQPFDPITQSYTVSVPNGTSQVQVTATTAETVATMTATVNEGTPATMTSGSAYAATGLHTGVNTIVMEVTAQNGTKKQYTLEVDVAKSANAKLSDLSVSGGTLSGTFDADTPTYDVSAPNGTSAVQVTATTADNTATMTVTVNGSTPATMTSGSAYAASGLHTGTNTIVIEVTAENGTTKNTYTLTVDVAKSANNNLSNLTVNGGTIQQIFDPSTTKYSVDLPSTHSVEITPTVEDSYATVTVDGQQVTSGSAATVTVSPGSTQDILVVVTAENGATNEYTLTVNVAKSVNADLSSLSVSGGTLNGTFDAATKDYTVSAPNGTSTVLVTATTAETVSTMTVKVNGGTADTMTSGSAYSASGLHTGTNTIEIIVAAQDGTTTKRYTLTVDVAKSANADLSDLTVSGGTLNGTFDAGTQTYTVSAANGTNQVQVTATTADNTATMTVTVNNGTPTTLVSGSAYLATGLHTGSNTIKIEVTAENGMTKPYTLTVDVAKSANADLNGLTVSGGTLNEVFSAATTHYTVSAANGTSAVNVTATTADDTATMTIAVNDGTPAPLTSGTQYSASGLHTGTNKVVIEVTAEIGTTNDYTLTVDVAKSANNNLCNLTVSGGTIQPTFDPSTTQYSVDVPGTHSVQVTPVVDDNTATVTVDGQPAASGTPSTVAVVPGSSQDISIIVTAENGATNEYTLTVNVAKSSNADLSDLTVSGGTLNEPFDASTSNYTVSAPNGTSAVNVTATVAESLSTMSVAVNDGTPETMTSSSAYTASGLHTGANKIEITIAAQDGKTTKTYTLTVNVAKSANANLNDLTVAGATLDATFDPDTQSYSVSEPNGTDHVQVTATIADPLATMTVAVNDGTAETITSGSTFTANGLHSGANKVVIEVTAEDGTTTKPYTLTVNVAKSTNNNLINLVVAGGTLHPTFTSSTTSYSVDVPSTHSVDITPTVEDSAATVTVDGNTIVSGSTKSVDVTPGSSRNISIIVTAESGATNEYTVTVNVAPSSNANLKNLTLSGGSMPAFDGSTHYDASVAYNATAVSVTPTVADSVSTLTVNDADATSGSPVDITLNDGATTNITIGVTAQDGTPKTYTITVTRRAQPSSNADLSNLTLSGGTMSAFDGSTAYDATVSYNATSVNVTATAADAGSTLTVNGDPATSGSATQVTLDPGATTTITIVVTAEDGVATNTYTITVTRSDAPPPPATNDATLSDLTISVGTLKPDFDPTKLNGYTVNVGSDVSQVDLTAVANNASATIKIRNKTVVSGTPVTLALSNGVNTFKVEVTAADGKTKKTYTVTITRGHKTTPQPPAQDWIDGTVHVDNGGGSSDDGSNTNSNPTKNIGGDLKLTGEIYDANGQKLNLPDIQFDANNNFKLPRIAPGTYHMAVYVTAPNGQKLAGQSVTLTVTQDKVTTTMDLIDPFGVVSDAMTKQPLADVKVSLYWADTELNRSLGRTPGTQVVLPELPDMAPNQNHNSQTTNTAGQYGWMVFPSGDYYVIAEKAGYVTYDSRNDQRNEAQGDTSYIRNGLIHVGQTVVQMNFSMQAQVIGGGHRTPYVFGTPNGAFQPNKGITRAELAAILTRILPADSHASTSVHFRDVSSSNWAAQSIADIYARGLMVGYPDGGFHPNDLVTRAQLAAILAKLKQLPAAQNASFTDIEGNWAKDAILRVKEAGYVSGYPDGTFRPNQAITRLETVVIINKLLGYHTQNVEGPQKWSDVTTSMWGYAEIMEASVAHDYVLYANGLEVWK